MKVVRRPLVLDAEPPNPRHRPDYLVTYKGRSWYVEKDLFLELYELEAVEKGKVELGKENAVNLYALLGKDIK